MTKEEQIKQKAEAEADKVIIGSGMDRASVIHLKHLLTTLYVQGYHTGAEPREKRIENMKCCGNCEHATHDSMNGTFCNYYSEWEPADLKCTQWELRR